MVSIHQQDQSFVFEVQGLHKLWALKSQITIPRENIVNAYRNTDDLTWIMGLRAPGTHIPGVLTAGSYYFTKDGTIFCDVSHTDKSIVVELKDEHYKKLIIEVEDVDAALNMLSK